MTRAAFASVSTALLVLCLAGCGHPPDSGTMDDTASIVLALTTVPSDVGCLEVTVSGAQTTTQRFDVTPNQAATITVQGLASGAATISERAFAVPCAQVTATTNPTWLSTMAVSVTLTPGQITDVTIVLRRAGQVRITTDFQDGTGATFSVSPPMVAFGNVTVPTAATMIVNITNTGTTAVAPPSLALSGPDAQLFTIQSSPNTGNPPCATTPSLPAGAACAVQIRFAPTSIGPKTATLNVGTVAGGTTPAATVPLSGTGVVTAAFSASPNPVAFGPLMVGFNSLVVVNITNTGTTAVAPPSLSVSGPDATQFSIQTPAGTGNPPCATTASVPAGGACATAIVFTPTSGGAKSATLNIASAGMVVTTVDLSGIGQATPPVLSASPNPVAFGTVGVGASVTTVVTVTNTGMSVVAMTSFISGTDSSQFTIVNTGNTGNPPCSSTASLAVGAACAAQIRFAPTSAGAKSASLSLGLTSAGTTVLTVPLTGTGVTATFSATPNPLNLGGVSIGASSSGIVTITNTSSFATAPPALSIGGTNAGQFAVVATTNTGNPPCATATSLPAGGACTTSVRFTPASAGAKTATLNIGTAANGTPAATVALTGSGV